MFRNLSRPYVEMKVMKEEGESFLEVLWKNGIVVVPIHCVFARDPRLVR